MAEVEEVVEEDTAGDTPTTVRTPNNRQPKTMKSKNSRLLIMTIFTSVKDEIVLQFKKFEQNDVATSIKKMKLVTLIVPIRTPKGLYKNTMSVTSFDVD
jgi:hypothetical protein